MSDIQTEIQQSNIIAGMIDSNPATESDTLLEAEGRQAEEGTLSRCLPDRPGTIDKVMNARKYGIDVIVIDDEDENEPSPTKPKKSLFGKPLSFTNSAISLNLLTPPASETNSPPYRSPFSVDEHAASSSYSRSTDSAGPFFSPQTPAKVLEPEIVPESMIASTASAEHDDVKKRLEQEGLNRSKELRQRKQELRQTKQISESRSDQSFVQPVLVDQATSLSTQGPYDRQTDILSSDDEDISQAWEMEGEASGRLIPKSPDRHPNPYSRDAADKYRTQDRHLETSEANVNSISRDVLQRTDEERQREDRLIRIREKQVYSNGKRKRSPQARFLPIDLSEGRKRPKFTDRTLINRPMATTTTVTQSNEILESSNESQLGSLRSMLKDGRKKAKPFAASAIVLENYDELFPSQDSEDVIDKNVQKLTGLTAEISRRRSMLDSRSMDLSAILLAGEKLAELLTIEEPSEHFQDWIKEIRLFTKAVLVDDRSGKLRRKRVNDLRQNAIRRLKKLGSEPREELVEARFDLVLTPEYAEKLRHEIPRVQTKLGEAQAAAKEQNRVTHNRKRDHRGTHLQHGLQSTTGLSVRSVADRGRAEQLRKQLAAYEGVGTIDLASGRVASDDDDDVSEEDDGEDIMRPISHINSRPDQTAVGTATSQGPVKTPIVSPFAEMPPPEQNVYTGTQRADAEISKRMQAKAAERSALDSQRQIAQPQTNDTEQVVESEEDDSELEDNESVIETESSDIAQDESGNAVARQYTVKVKTTGLGEEDKNEIIFYESFSKIKANKNLLAVTAWFVKRFELYNPDVKIEKYSLKTEANEANTEVTQIFEYTSLSITYGYRASLVTRELTLTRAAYEKAKTRKVLKSLKIWVVDFEKTIRPCQEDPEADNHNLSCDEEVNTRTQLPEPAHQDSNANIETQEHLQITQPSSRSASPEDERDSIFGDDNSPPSSASPPSTCTSTQSTQSEPVVERANLDQLRPFTDVARANRHAKEVFAAWYHRALPGRQHVDEHRAKDEAFERELERVGDMRLLNYNEECKVANRDGTMYWEHMRVWVREYSCIGANN